jgi:hypothetical protein
VERYLWELDQAPLPERTRERPAGSLGTFHIDLHTHLDLGPASQIRMRRLPEPASATSVISLLPGSEAPCVRGSPVGHEWPRNGHRRNRQTTNDKRQNTCHAFDNS